MSDTSEAPHEPEAPGLDPLPPIDTRRHDLDALRAFAMLLGIAFHLALSFTQPVTWFVVDDSRAPGYRMFTDLSHGFRMQLFFVVSGFFTAMIWARRGAFSLLWNRFLRIFLPLVVGCWTITAINERAFGFAFRSGELFPEKESRATGDAEDLWSAARTGDIESLEELLGDDKDGGESHPQWGVSVINTASDHGQADVVEFLLENGTDANARGRNSRHTLHSAVFFGHDDIVELLLEHGANPRARSPEGQFPHQTAEADWETTRSIMRMVGVDYDRKDLMAGRERAVERLLEAAPDLARENKPEAGEESAREEKKGGILAALGKALRGKRGELLDAIRDGDPEAVSAFLEDNPDFDLDRSYLDAGLHALGHAAARDDASLVAVLLEAGANPDAPHQDGGTALAVAVLRGSAGAAEVLLEAGADPELPDRRGRTPRGLLDAEGNDSVRIASRLGLDYDEEAVRAGRSRIAHALGAHFHGIRSAWKRLSGWWQDHPRLGEYHHLWFLWFLCLLVPVFLVAVLPVRIFQKLGLVLPPAYQKGLHALVATPLCLLWLVPLVVWPQTHMGGTSDLFGPHTVTKPAVPGYLFAYYAVFFGFGALYYATKDRDGHLGRGWWLVLPIALLVVAPPAYQLVTRRELYGWDAASLLGSPTGDSRVILGDILQALFTCLMILGLFGLFRFLFGRRRNPVARYISDSSYWLYVAHLALVVVAQRIVRDWDQPAWFKLLLLTTLVVGGLLVVYQLAVRNSVVGYLLNGSRQYRKMLANHPREQFWARFAGWNGLAIVVFVALGILWTTWIGW